MGFFTELGSVVGTIAGGVVGGTVSLVGDIVDSNTIREIGEGAYKVTANTGKQLGRFADGAAKCVGGVISDDGNKVSDGAKEMFDTATETVTSVGKGIASTVIMGLEGVDALLDGDEKRAVEVGKKFVKGAAIGVLSFGILDAIDGVMDGSVLDSDHDGVPDFLDNDTTPQLVENPNMHHVEPHWRHYADGSRTWVDGDGDSTVNTDGGWMQHNPDYRV